MPATSEAAKRNKRALNTLRRREQRRRDRARRGLPPVQPRELIDRVELERARAALGLYEAREYRVHL